MKPCWLVLLAACGKPPPCAHQTTPRGAITTCSDGSYKRELAGVIVEEAHYTNGMRDGAFVSRYVTGAPHLRGRYLHGARVGGWKSSHENGATWVETEYVDGEPHGVWTELDFDGSKMFVGTYDHGKLEGGWKTWRSEGKLRAEGESHGGKLEGRVTQYFESGGRMEQHWKANRLHGAVVIYDETDKVLQSLEFADGVEVKK